MRALRRRLAAACLLCAGPASAAEGTLWITGFDGAFPLARQAPVAISASCPAGGVEIDVDPAARFQTIDGFGAAATESSALALAALPSARRGAALRDLFGADGPRISMLRVPIGASDFSLGNYSCDDVPAGESDPELRHFDFQRCMGPILPLLKDAEAIRPGLKLIAAPWSAPAWMKTNGSMNAGSLRPEFFAAYAAYLTRFAVEMGRAGTPLAFLTAANEPLNPNPGYPTMLMTAADQARFLGRFLGPALEKAGLWPGLKVLAFDHNWNHVDYPMEVLADTAAARYVAGSAFHCYEGSPAGLETLTAAHPDKEIQFTECSGGGWKGGLGGPFSASFPWGVETVALGDLTRGARSVLLWNLALDEAHGPTNGGCVNCRGLLTVSRTSGTYETTSDYFLLEQISFAADPGARRVAAVSPDGSPALPRAAFLEPDGGFGALVVNRGGRDLTVNLRAPSGCLSYRQPARSAATLRWPARRRPSRPVE